jgi:putative ABC transport system permease protein
MADAGSKFARLTSEIAQDTGYAVRTLRREPALLLGVVCTLALALGVNAAMFGVVSRLLFSPPAGVTAPESVYRVNFAVRTERGDEFVLTSTSYPAFQQLRDTRAFAAIAAVRTVTATVDRGENVAAISGIGATGNYFEVLGAKPQLGRFFGPADDELPLGNSVVVLSNEFWRRRFAGQRNIIGSEVIINNERFTIIGVAAPRFTGDAVAPVDVFLPLSAALRHDSPGWWSNARMNVVSLVARVTGQADAAAQRATNVIAQLDADSPRDLQRSVRLESLVPGTSARATPRGRIALWLSGVTIVVLLTAAANVGTLLLLRAARRRRDLSLRLALGIGRARMLRQLVIESLVLALAGGAVGLIVSHWMAELLRAALFQDLAASERFVDRGVLLLTAAASCAVGLLAALSPLLMVARLDISNALKVGERSSVGRSRTRVVLVSAQVGLSTVLLVGAGLFVRSLERVRTQDLGYSLEHLLFVSLDFTQPVSGLESDRLHRLARDRIARVPRAGRAQRD